MAARKPRSIRKKSSSVKSDIRGININGSNNQVYIIYNPEKDSGKNVPRIIKTDDKQKRRFNFIDFIKRVVLPLAAILASVFR